MKIKELRIQYLVLAGVFETCPCPVACGQPARPPTGAPEAGCPSGRAQREGVGKSVGR